MLIVDGDTKFVINRSGELLWSTDLRLDPNEQVNLLAHSVQLPEQLSGHAEMLLGHAEMLPKLTELLPGHTDLLPKHRK